MRRRDAHRTLLPTLGHRPKGPAIASTLVSAALHVAALAVAVAITVRTVPAPQLLRISFIPGGGQGEAAGGASGAGAASAPAPAESTVVAVPAPAPPAPVAVAKPRPQAIPRPPARPRARIAGDTARPIDRGTGADAASETPVQEAAAGQGEGLDSGSGEGSGTGGGSGGGIGRGSGSGAGDHRAHCLYCPEPRYPIVARQRGWEGTVRVGLAVGSDGHVESASLRRSSGYDALDDAAVAVARRSRFTPPEAEGLAAPLHGHIEYRFQLSQAP